jgi:iron complex outermembrane receptor protein
MKPHLMLSSLLGLGLGLGLAFVHPAAAQQAPLQPGEGAPAATQDAGDRDQDRDTVIVTATRRDEPLQDVPLSITAFSQEDLTAAGIVGYEGLARATPGIVVNKPSANFNTFTARGIATNGYGANLQSTVAIYVDELPISNTGNQTVVDTNLFDVERVEFLRGPQGTLFGSGSLSGALRILTKSPDLNDFDVAATADFGITEADSFRQRYNGMVNVPLIEDVAALRVVGFYRDEDGYIDNVQTGITNANSLDNYGGRAILLVEPTDRLSVRLLASYETSEPGDSSLTNPTLGAYKRRSVRPDTFGGTIENYNATIGYEFDGATLTSSSTYSHFDQQFVADISAAVGRAFPYALDARGPQETFVQEVRLVSDPGDTIDWVIGAFYLDRTTELRNDIRTTAAFLASRGLTGAQGPSGDLIQSQNLQQTQQEVALFGELTYRFSDQFWVTGGMRYGETERQLFVLPGAFTSNFVTAALTNATGPLTIVPVPAATRPLATGSSPSYKLSASYRITDDITSYATVSTGYRAPAHNANAGRVSAIDPTDLVIPEMAGSDELTNYEVGVKGTYFDGMLTANLALYYIDWQDIQVQANRTSDSAQFATNIGGARSQGLEFEAAIFPTDYISFGFSGSIGDTEITDLSVSEAAISGAVLGDSLSAPDFQGSAYAQLDFGVSEDVSGYFNATIQHVGSFQNMFPNVPGRPTVQAPTFGYTDEYQVVNLSLGLTSGDLSATFYVENLLDDDATTYLHPEGFLDSRYGLLQPRTVGVRLGYSL